MKSRLSSLLCLLVLGSPLPARAAPDWVLTWNSLCLEVIRFDNSPPTLASRNLAILHTAVYDAVNSIEKTHQPYRQQIDPAGPADADAAACGAAHAVLVVLYPQYWALFDLAYEQFLTTTPDTAARTEGLDLGRRIGLLAVGSRDSDGASTEVPYVPSDAPGQWRRTPPDYRPPLDPHWRYVDPFCLDDLEPFVVPPPPPLASAAYAEDVQAVMLLGAASNSVRSPAQSEIAVFWSDFSYTATPPGHWHEIAADLATAFGNTPAENARLFALLSLAQADAGIVAWEGKFRYNFWRPITAIGRADEDTNPSTVAVTNWSSYLVSPPFPEYPSGHSTFSKASAVVLARFFGTDAISFEVRSESLPGTVRNFPSLSVCADEVGLSRIYGGIHFASANRHGKASGAAIGEYVSRNFLLLNDRLPLLRWERSRNQRLQLRIHGRLGRPCVLEASPDLQGWTAVLTNTAVAGGFTFAPGIGDGEARGFFRVQER